MKRRPFFAGYLDDVFFEFLQYFTCILHIMRTNLPLSRSLLPLFFLNLKHTSFHVAVSCVSRSCRKALVMQALRGYSFRYPQEKAIDYKMHLLKYWRIQIKINLSWNIYIFFEPSATIIYYKCGHFSSGVCVEINL